MILLCLWISSNYKNYIGESQKQKYEISWGQSFKIFNFLRQICKLIPTCFNYKYFS
jgi:hypothetical protein